MAQVEQFIFGLAVRTGTQLINESVLYAVKKTVTANDDRIFSNISVNKRFRTLRKTQFIYRNGLRDTDIPSFF